MNGIGTWMEYNEIEPLWGSLWNEAWNGATTKKFPELRRKLRAHIYIYIYTQQACVFSTMGIQKYPQFPLIGQNMKEYYKLYENNVVVLYYSYSPSLTWPSLESWHVGMFLFSCHLQTFTAILPFVSRTMILLEIWFHMLGSRSQIGHRSIGNYAGVFESVVVVTQFSTWHLPTVISMF